MQNGHPTTRNVLSPNRAGLPSNQRWTALGIFLFALALRLAYLAEMSRGPTFYNPVYDSLAYDTAARALAAGRPMPEEFFWQGFFYPLYLAVAYFLTGGSILWAKLIQAVVGALTCVLVYRIGRRVVSFGAALAAAAICAACGPIIFYEGELLAAVWALFWFTLSVLLFLRVAEERRLFPCFLLGVVGALATLTRGPLLAPFLAGLAWLAVRWWKAPLEQPRRVRGRRILMNAFAVGAGFLLVAGPAAWQCRRMTGEAHILPGTNGINLAIGNNPDRAATQLMRPDYEFERLRARPHELGIVGLWPENRFFQGEFLSYARANPVGFAIGLFEKTREFFTSREIPRNFNIYSFRPWSRLLAALVWRIDGFGFPFGVLFPLALVGFARERKQLPLLFPLLVMAYAAAIILVFATGRYRVLTIPLLSIPAGAELMAMIDWARLRQWKPLAGALAGLAAIAGLISLPAHFRVEGDEKIFAVEMLFHEAQNQERLGKVDQAVEILRRALALAPGYHEALYRLGAILAKTGRTAEAEQDLSTALETAPRSVKIHEALGDLAARAGRRDQAIEHYYVAASFDPYAWRPRAALGAILLRMGRPDAALSPLRTAAKLNPMDDQIHFDLGTTYLRLGDRAEALKEFLKVLRLKPDRIDACLDAGTLLSETRKFQIALALFERAVQLRPDLAAAHFNLAGALFETEQYIPAIEQYQAALKLEPGRSSTLYRLGLACEKANRPDQARDAFQRTAEAAQAAGDQALLEAAREKLTPSR